MATKRKRVQEQIDEMMERVPDPPKGFGDWVIKNSMPRSKYVFYRKMGKKAHGVCSCCGERVVYQDDKYVKYIKHNRIGKCPNCNKVITFKAINKAKYFKDKEVVSVMQKMKGTKQNQYVIRYFQVIKVFKHAEDTSNFPEEILNTLVDPEYFIWEGSREILTIQKNGKTKWGAVEELYDYKSGKMMWKTERKRSGYFNKELLRDSNPFMYTRNLKRLLKNTKWKYSGLDHYTEQYMNMGDYLVTYEEYPTLEMLSKMGANRLVREIIHDYTRGWGGLQGYIDARKKFLGVNKGIFQRAVNLNISAQKIEFLVILDELKYNLTDDQVLWAIEHTHTETFTQLLRYASANKIISYIENQLLEKGEENDSSRHIATSWRDYLHECDVLGFDLGKDYFRFPKDLEERHREYSKMIKAQDDEFIDKGIVKTFNEWKDLDYKDGIYKIVVARNQKMIIAEGSCLSHCVGGTTYTRGMARGDKIILMIRKNNKPYTTLEFNPMSYKIVQNRGKWNCDKADSNEFAEKWLKKHVEKIKKKKLSQNIEKTITPVTSPVPGGMNHERIAI